jgi:hypothetical protein
MFNGNLEAFPFLTDIIKLGKRVEGFGFIKS